MPFIQNSTENSHNYCDQDFLQLNEGEIIVFLPKCKHIFHEKCFKAYLEHNTNCCPTCGPSIDNY